MSHRLALCLGLTLASAPAAARDPGTAVEGPAQATAATADPAAQGTQGPASVGTTPSTPPRAAGAPAVPDPRVATASTPPQAPPDWARKRRKLQIQTGVAGGLSGLFLLTGLLLIFVSPTCSDPDPDFGCGEGYGRYYTAFAMFPGAVIAAIPAIVYGVRLGRHNRTNPAWVRLQPASGGLALRF